MFNNFRNPKFCAWTRAYVRNFIYSWKLKIFKIYLIKRLGAVHDGQTYQGIDASRCPASANNIMTPNVGAFYDATAMYYFSDCSIDAFKNTLLTQDRQ